MSQQHTDWLDSLTDAEYEALNADQDDGRAAFEDAEHIMCLDALGNSHEPERCEEFDRFEGECEHGLEQTVRDLLGIKWTVEKIVERVVKAARDVA